MAIRADIATGYRWRLGLIAACCIGFSLWALYDGKVKYPAQRVRAEKYVELKEAERLDEWPAIAEEQGWPLEDPGEPKTDYDIMMQFGMSGLAGLVGLVFGAIYLLNGGRWVEADENGLQTSRRQQCSYDEITTLNKKKWRNKGIAVVHFERQGRKGRVTLDDCKYEQYPTEAILREVESRIDLEQIVGGRPEPVEEEQVAPEEDAEEARQQADPQQDEGDRGAEPGGEPGAGGDRSGPHDRAS